MSTAKKKNIKHLESLGFLVLPAKGDSKFPGIKAWQKHTSRKTAVAAFEERHGKWDLAEDNYIIRMPRGFVGLDFDDYQGAMTFLEHVSRNYESDYVKAMPVGTPSGGIHFVFRMPDERGNFLKDTTPKLRKMKAADRRGGHRDRGCPASEGEGRVRRPLARPGIDGGGHAGASRQAGHEGPSRGREGQSRRHSFLRA